MASRIEPSLALLYLAIFKVTSMKNRNGMHQSSSMIPYGYSQQRQSVTRESFSKEIAKTHSVMHNFQRTKPLSFALLLVIRHSIKMNIGYLIKRCMVYADHHITGTI